MTVSSGTGVPSTNRRRPINWFAYIWGLPIVIWQALFFLSALLFLVAMTFWRVRNFRLSPDFDFANWLSVFSSNSFYETFFRTLGYASLAAVIASLIAFPCAYALAFRVPAWARRLAIFMLITPYFTSYLVRIYSWKILLTDQGVLNLLFGLFGLGPFKMYNNLYGTTVGYLTLCLPLVVLLQLVSLVNVDRNLISAAHNLGCGRFKTIWMIIIPAAKAGLILAATFAFILSFGDFVSPTLLGGSKPPTLSIMIVDTVRSGSNWPRASVISVTMIVTLLLVAFAALRFAYGGKVARK
jgi:ABC-type spermidine/putrescine transport system permease subunit I